MDDLLSEISITSSSSKGGGNRSVGSLTALSNRTVVDSDLQPIAGERWNVQKKQREQNDQLKQFYDTTIAKCQAIESSTNKKATELYNAMYYNLKWANPPIAIPHSRLILNYCRHVILQGSTVVFPQEVELATWNQKVKGQLVEKSIMKAKRMYKQLFQLIKKRDDRINQLQNDLLMTSEKMKIKHDTTLRFLIESNFNTRDKFFTLWNLASSNKIRELDVLLNAASKADEYKVHGINSKDPDFGLTALHYACRNAHVAMVEYLLGNGADPSIRGPDGRTSLHYAAAYATRNICLMLLATGMDVNARDYYECTALDLAKQNSNTATIATLENWSGLTSLSIDHSTQSALPATNEIDAIDAWLQDAKNIEKAIPEEYKPVDAILFDQMSPALKLLTKRLNGFNPHLLLSSTASVTAELRMANTFAMSSIASCTGTGPQPTFDGLNQSTTQTFVTQLSAIDQLLTEIRLCTKHFTLCLQEKMFSESVRTLQRRWAVSKLLHQQLLEQRQQRAEEVLQEQTELDEMMKEDKLSFALRRMLPKDDASEYQRVGNGPDEVIDALDEVSLVTMETNTKDNIDARAISKSVLPSQELAIDQSTFNRCTDSCAFVDAGELEKDEERDDDDDDEPVLSLERLACDFFKTATNITYLPTSPRPLDTSAQINHPASASLPTNESTVADPPLQKVVLSTSGMIVAEDAISVSESSPTLLLPVPQTISVSALEREQEQKLQLDTSQSGYAKAMPSHSRMSQLSNPSYILQTLNAFANRAEAKRLEEYSWRYENNELLDHYTQFSTTASLIDSNMSLSSSLLSANQPLAPNKESMRWNTMGNFVVRMGFELAEVFVVLKKWDTALQTLNECLHVYHDVLLSNRINVLLQLCDILVYVTDHRENCIDQVDVIVDLICSVDVDNPAMTWLEPSSWLSPKGSIDAFDSPDRLHTRHGDASFYKESTATFNVVDSSYASADTFQRPLSADNATHSSQQQQQQLILEFLLRKAQEVIDLSYLLSQHDLIEPFSVAQALSFISRAHERLLNYPDAWQYAEEASLIAVRSRGACLDSVQFMIDAQRLFVRHKLRTEDDLQFVACKTVEINHLLAQCGDDWTNASDQQRADRFWRESAELNALATIAIRDSSQSVSALAAPTVSVHMHGLVDVSSTLKSVDRPGHKMNVNKIACSASLQSVSVKKKKKIVRYL